MIRTPIALLVFPSATCSTPIYFILRYFSKSEGSQTFRRTRLPSTSNNSARSAPDPLLPMSEAEPPRWLTRLTSCVTAQDSCVHFEKDGAHSRCVVLPRPFRGTCVRLEKSSSSHRKEPFPSHPPVTSVAPWNGLQGRDPRTGSAAAKIRGADLVDAVRVVTTGASV